MSSKNIPTRPVYKYHDAFKNLVSPQNKHEIASADVLAVFKSLQLLQEVDEEVDKTLLPEIVPQSEEFMEQLMSSNNQLVRSRLKKGNQWLKASWKQNLHKIKDGISTLPNGSLIFKRSLNVGKVHFKSSTNDQP